MQKEYLKVPEVLKEGEKMDLKVTYQKLSAAAAGLELSPPAPVTAALAKSLQVSNDMSNR